MKNVWMIRAGEGGRLIGSFAKGYVAVGWIELGDMSQVSELEKIRQSIKQTYPNERKGAIGNSVAMFHKFRSVVQVGDHVISYDPGQREYLVGVIKSEYQYKPGVAKDYPHIREVDWQSRVKRDDLSTSSRNSLGSTLTLFAVNEDVWADIQSALQGGKSPESGNESLEDEKTTLDEIRQEMVGKAHEFIKDKILALSADEMEELTAAILRGMGYRTRISPKGPDRGVDVFASPDGLGLEEPRIKAEVKHRQGSAMGSQNIRSFLGGLREGDRALYISTGGFTKDAKYEADRANVPLTLLDLDELANLVVTHYENFDLEGRALIPLVRLYWPAE
ncbi:MAG: restriction endonuclease [Desulfobulbaceae bacterium]|jgi:restriction system protein|nr:restriction endonuclease [Desulfobulbaceae bacterium]